MHEDHESAPDEATRAMVFFDFDGTISCRDATDAILEMYADPAWQQIEQKWTRAEIGSRECLTQQMALVTATNQEIDSLLDTIEVDAGFLRVLEVCRAHQLPAHIVSDGFDRCIHRILSRPRLGLAPYLAEIPVISSHLEQEEGRWQASFGPAAGCTHGCGTCKPSAMHALNPCDHSTIFIGDGLSDRYAAAYADFVFAKGALAGYCDQHAIPFQPYDTLATVAGDLERIVRSAAMSCRSCSRTGA
jgi:2-hydroxy-3-keto-5-methylthiopentenyl-1-phosphate phosphatase